LKERLDRLFNNPESDFIPGDNLFLALWADADTVRNPNATGSVLNMVPREFDNRTSLITDPPDGRLPLVTPEGRRRQSAGLASNLTAPWQFGATTSGPAQSPPVPASASDLSNVLRCITWGVPKIAGNINYTSHQQIFQGPGYVVLLSEVNHEARVIPLDGRPHLPDGLRQWNGFTRIGPDRIDYERTVTDPTIWTKPWTAVIRLKSTSDRLQEFACHEGNHYVVRGILGAARADEK
jgi:hypothetical protein